MGVESAAATLVVRLEREGSVVLGVTGSTASMGRLLAVLAAAALATRTVAVEPRSGTVAVGGTMSFAGSLQSLGTSHVSISRARDQGGLATALEASGAGLLYLAPWVAAGLEVGAFRRASQGDGLDYAWVVGPVVELDLRVARRLSLVAQGRVGWTGSETLQADDWTRGLEWGGAGGIKLHLGRNATLDLMVGCRWRRQRGAGMDPPVRTLSLFESLTGLTVYFDLAPASGAGVALPGASP